MNDSNSNALPIGYILNNKYKIIGKLGEGGFGITYLAEETTLHHKVAIKEFMPREHANRSQMNNSISPYT
jgi:serine/threonine protein kinase